MSTTPRRRIKPDNEIPSRRISEHVICSETEIDMTNESKKQRGAFGRVLDAIVAWENALEYRPYDYVLDRVCSLEREVVELRDELRASPAGNEPGGRMKPATSTTDVPQ